jgi:hypothetical protein
MANFAELDRHNFCQVVSKPPRYGFESFDDRQLAILNLREGGHQYGPSAKNGEVRQTQISTAFS